MDEKTFLIATYPLTFRPYFSILNANLVISFLPCLHKNNLSVSYTDFVQSIISKVNSLEIFSISFSTNIHTYSSLPKCSIAF